MDDWIRIAALAASFAIAGCAVTPVEDAARSAAQQVEARTALAPGWPPDGAPRAPAPPVDEPLTLPAALALAFSGNPEIQRQYARLGITHADLLDAARIANPTLSLAWLDPQGGGRDKTTQGISASFADLLLLSARRRLATAELRRVEFAVGAALVDLAHRVETAWYEHVGALQVAALREAVAEAARREAEIAGRYHAAGNISRLQLDLQQAATARAEVDALRARAAAATARSRLADLLGQPASGGWRTVDRLAVPPAGTPGAEDLGTRAASQRLDLAAAREEVAVLEDARGVASRWRLLGAVEAGYERERETDGTELRGPTLSLELPIFDQGQGAVARADAQLLDARARLSALELSVANEVSAAAARLALAREAAERYRDAWLPAAESAVARQQERFNFMLAGVFELIQAKRDQYDAWQGYLESVRDYWIARTALRAATGGLLPGDDQDLTPTEGPDEIVPPPANEHHGDHHS